MKKPVPLKTFEIPIRAGAFRGRKIAIPDLPTTRSSKAIVRESLFDTLQFAIVDAPFVEVFAGSGSVGLEALSRGAGFGYFIEKNREVYVILERNIRAIAPERAEAIRGDSFTELSRVLSRLEAKGEAAYFYVDPPFSIREGMEDIYERTLDLIASIDPVLCRQVIVEHMSSVVMPETIGQLVRHKSRRFGKTTLSYFG